MLNGPVAPTPYSAQPIYNLANFCQCMLYGPVAPTPCSAQSTCMPRIFCQRMAGWILHAAWLEPAALAAV